MIRIVDAAAGFPVGMLAFNAQRMHVAAVAVHDPQFRRAVDALGMLKDDLLPVRGKGERPGELIVEIGERGQLAGREI